MRIHDIAVADTPVSSSELSFEELTHQANRLLEKNDLKRAYPLVVRLTHFEQVDVDTLMMAGLMAFTLGKKEEAIAHLERAHSRDADHYDAAYNLALVYMANNAFDQAAETLNKLIAKHPTKAELYNDLAVVWMNKQNIPQVFQTFEKALEVNPNFQKARENAMRYALEHRWYDEGKRLLKFNAEQPALTNSSRADITKWEKELEKAQATAPSSEEKNISRLSRSSAATHRLTGKKIAFFATQQTFITDIIQRLSKDNTTRLFQGTSAQEMRELLEWAEVAWFEWCDVLLIEATKLPKRCPIICRLHSYEAFTDMPSKVDWSKVDALVFVNRSVEEIFRRQVRAEVPVTIIHNGVDTAKFSIPSEKKYGKKIASVGYINYKKNPALLLYCFKKIHSYDNEYTFHIAGQHQDPRIQIYFEHFLKENPLPITFYGWVDDMPSWYADKDYVMSTSLFESFHYSIAEGMASGVLPLIHDWYGAANIYPKEYLFSDPDDCLRLLQRLEREDKHELARRNRQYIVERYNQEEKQEQIERLLSAVLEGKSVSLQEESS